MGPPSFPDEPPPPTLPELERITTEWTDDADTDIERRCRSLRSTAIRHAAAAGELDADAVARQLTLTDR